MADSLIWNGDFIVHEHFISSFLSWNNNIDHRWYILLWNSAIIENVWYKPAWNSIFSDL